MIPISPRWRLALAAKGALLAAIALGFAAMAVTIALGRGQWLVRVPVIIVFAYLTWFLGWAAALAFADAISGVAIREPGAQPLASRRAGWSLRTPDGRFVEYVLWNPWGPLEQNRSYTVTFGRRSRVLVAKPEAEP